MSNFSPARIHAMIGHRPRLLGGIILGLIVGLLLPDTLTPTFRAIAGWDTVAVVYLVLAFTHMAHCNSAESMKHIAAREDQNGWMILVVMTIASFISLIAIGTLLSTIKGLDSGVAHLHLVLGIFTVVSSWSMMHMIFSVHYAHEYYGDSNDSPDNYEAYRGLMFPGDKDPVFTDFLYYAFVVGMTCQVSDIQVSSQVMRRLTLAHGVLAFFFNTVILALSINIAAGLLS